MKQKRKHSAHSKTVKIEPYIVDSAEHEKGSVNHKPLHLNVEQVLKGHAISNQAEEIQLQSNVLELVEDEKQALHARKNRLSNPLEHTKGSKLTRQTSRYTSNNTHATLQQRKLFLLKKQQPASIKDYSVNGACLLSNSSHKKGKIINLCITISNPQNTYNFAAKVIYSTTAPTQGNEKTYMTGVRFLDATVDYKDFVIQDALKKKLKPKH